MTDSDAAISLSPLGQPELGASTMPNPLCEICSQGTAIYTCPRCHSRTCSLPCSSTHKKRDACSGERNKAAYVAMNQYSWGTMMNDYVFLEDVGRKVGDWGKEIARGGYVSRRGGVRGRGSARGNTRGGMRGQVAGGGKSKRDVLKMHLEWSDIEMELLPAGMDKRKLNQSSWDSKTQTAFLTIEYKFHPPVEFTTHPSFTLLTHRNNIRMPLLSLIQTSVIERSRSRKDSTVPPWLKTLVSPDTDDPEGFTQPVCVMKASPDLIPTTRGLQPRTGHFKLDAARKLFELLQGKSFVEFPTIEVWEDGTFTGTVMDPKGVFEYEEQRPKRRKLDARAGKKAINGLVGGYGSEEDAKPTVLSALGGYADSDEERVKIVTEGEQQESPLADEDMGDGLGSDEDVDVNLEPAALLELIRQKHGEDWEGNVDMDEVERDETGNTGDVNWGAFDEEPDEE